MAELRRREIMPSPLIQAIRSTMSRSGAALLCLRQPAISGLVARLKRDGLTYLEPQALVDLHDAVRHVERRKIPGVFLEAGCALGGSAIVIAWSKTRSRQFLLYDVFSTIPAPSTHDGPAEHARYETITSGRAMGLQGNPYYGYCGDLSSIVGSNLATFGLTPDAENIRLVKGLYQDTLWPPTGVAFAHIDCDWYESVLTCLSRIAPRLIRGGTLVIDDYHQWSGCRRAVDEYFADKMHLYQFRLRSRLHVIRK